MSSSRQVDWRFLTHPDSEPGFSTSWLQSRSLENEVKCREWEYQDSIMAEFAEEFGVRGIFHGHGDDPDGDRGQEEDLDTYVDGNHGQRDVCTESPLMARLNESGRKQHLSARSPAARV